MEKVSINLIMNVKYKYNLTLCTPGLFRSIQLETPNNSNRAFGVFGGISYSLFMISLTN